MPAMNDENTSPNTAPDVFYVPEKVFEALKQKLTKGEETSTKETDFLVNWDLADDDNLVPVDMNGAGENLDEFEVAMGNLGPTKTLECFVKAQKHFEALKNKPADAKPMTVKQWRKLHGDEEPDEEETLKTMYIPDLFHIPLKHFESVKKKLTEGSEVT